MLRFFPCFGQGYELDAAQAHIPTTPMYDRAQEPTFCSRWVYHEVEAIAVSITTLVRALSHLDAGERVVRMLAFAFHIAPHFTPQLMWDEDGRQETTLDELN